MTWIDWLIVVIFGLATLATGRALSRLLDRVLTLLTWLPLVGTASKLISLIIAAALQLVIFSGICWWASQSVRLDSWIFLFFTLLGKQLWTSFI